jgi:hypothetical protein
MEWSFARGTPRKFKLELVEKDGQIDGMLAYPGKSGDPDRIVIKLEDPELSGGEFRFEIFLELPGLGKAEKAQCSAPLERSDRMAGRWVAGKETGTWIARKMIKF